MFGADAAQVSILETNNQHYEARHQDTFEYLFPKFSHQSPWQLTGNNRNKSPLEDFILLAEFSEQEGPRPVIVIPKDGGQNFDQNEFSVKILAVDHQSSIVEGCETTEDAQVVMSDPDTDTHAFIHHIVLNDIQARGYVRPFCISYVTSDPIKIMNCYEEISSELRKVARLMKYGNRLVFMRDLEKRQEDLSFTQAHLLLSQNKKQVSSQGDSDLGNTLNTIKQCMEEVKDILSNLKPLIQVDTELAEKFQFYERELRSRHQNVDSDSSSLNDFKGKESILQEPGQLSGSYTDRTTPEFSLFSKAKDQKPKILDVSTIRGKRRFDRSLRGLHELCSWGAKEGLQKLRAFREFLKRDLASIYVDELDMAALVPEKGALCFANNTVGVNFLSTSGSIKNSCCVKRKVSEVGVHHTGLSSLGSMESFKSLSSSFQSFHEDDTMYSANSSIVETVSSGITLDRQFSELSGRDSSDIGQDESELQFPHENTLGISDNSDFVVTDTDWQNSLLDTLTADSIDDSLKGLGEMEKNKLKLDLVSEDGKVGECCIVEEDNSLKVRSTSDSSEFENIDKERDLKCKAKGCLCDKKKIHDNATKCNIVNGAGLENQNVVKAVCDICDDDKISVPNEEGLKVTAKVVNGKKEMLVEEKEKITVGDDDLTPVMSVSADTLIDKFAVIIDNDSQLNAETDQNNRYTSDTENNAAQDIDNESQKGTSQRRVTCITSNESISQTEETVNDNEIINDTNNISLESGSLDSGLNFDNTQSLDFDSLSSTQSDGVLGKDGTKSESESSDLSDEHKVWEEKSMFGSTSHDRRLGIDASRRRKWKLMHPFRNLVDGEHSVGQSLQRVLVSYNNLQHVVYSLLSGRPVIVIGNKRQEVAIKEFVQAMSVFVPYTPRLSGNGVLCLIKQLKVSDLQTFQLRGVIRTEKRSVDYLVPKSVRRYVTLVDLERTVVYCQTYQGILLNFLTSIHSKKKTFKSDTALLPFIQLCLQEISTKAFSFYHTASKEEWDLSGATLPHKSCMIELSMEKYLNRAGIMNSDCRIVKHLTEIVKLQQIEDEFRSKFLTDAPFYPFSVAHQSLHTYRL